MSYTTQQELIDRYSENVLLMLADQDNDGVLDAVVIAEAITDASELMDSYLAKRYTLPLPVVPMPLKRICGDITLYLLSGNGTVTDERRKRYDDAIKFLQALAKGDATLGAGVEQDNANSVGQVELDSNPRIFTRRTLRGVM
jgi:phage gp36-like protein